MIITSRQNPLIKKIVSLKEKKGRREHGLYIVEGIKQVREALLAGCEVELAVFSENFSALSDFPCETAIVSQSVFEKLSEEKAPQGVLALVRLPECNMTEPTGNSLLLDGVSDPGNLGTILRTANAAGYEDIYLLNNCADPFSPKCVRSSMSGVFFVRLHIGSMPSLTSALQGIPLLCADMAGENIFRFTPPQKFCLVIGNEANGVSEAVRELCTYTVSIPMRHSCESLNAGVSAGILMYLLQQNRGEAK